MNAVVRPIRADAKCRRMYSGKRCGARLAEHVDGMCPGIDASTFLRQRPAKHRVSLSMTDDAIEAAQHIVSGLLMGKSAADLRSHKGFTDLAKVVISTAKRARSKP